MLIKLFIKDKYWHAFLLKKNVFLDITYRRFNNDFRVRANKWFSKLYMNAKYTSYLILTIEKQKNDDVYVLYCLILDITRCSTLPCAGVRNDNIHHLLSMFML